MTKLSQIEKEQLSGGLGPMMLWVGLVGGCLLLTTIAQLFSGSSRQKSDTPTSYNLDSNNSYHSSNQNSTYMRISPMMQSSAFYLPV